MPATTNNNNKIHSENKSTAPPPLLFHPLFDVSDIWFPPPHHQMLLLLPTISYLSLLIDVLIVIFHQNNLFKHDWNSNSNDTPSIRPTKADHFYFLLTNTEIQSELYWIL
jgi:hypothetical protein